MSSCQDSVICVTWRICMSHISINAHAWVCLQACLCLLVSGVLKTRTMPYLYMYISTCISPQMRPRSNDLREESDKASRHIALSTGIVPRIRPMYSFWLTERSCKMRHPKSLSHLAESLQVFFPHRYFPAIRTTINVWFAERVLQDKTAYGSWPPCKTYNWSCVSAHTTEATAHTTEATAHTNMCSMFGYLCMRVYLRMYPHIVTYMT